VTHHLFLTALLAAAAAPVLAQTAPAAQPAQAPQPVSRTVFMQRIDSAFVTVDANKDGFTDRAEMEAAQTRALTQRKAQVLRDREAAFRHLDANKDGSLTLQEFNGPTAAQPLPKANATPALTRFDTNKDGKVSLAENRAPALAEFDRADANKDGILSVEERARPRR
jgi:hypothetical protein